MFHKIARIVLILSLLLIPAIPVAAQDDCTLPLIFYSDSGVDGPSNNGTFELPFKTRDAAEAAAREQRSTCVVRIVDGVPQEVYTVKLVGETGLPLAQSGVLFLTGIAVVALLGVGFWLRRRANVGAPA